VKWHGKFIPPLSEEGPRKKFDSASNATGIRLYAIPPSMRVLSVLNEGQDPRYESKVDAQEHIHSMRRMFLCAIDLAEQEAIHKNRFTLKRARFEGWGDRRIAGGEVVLNCDETRINIGGSGMAAYGVKRRVYTVDSL
jgi:hypothetical protein